jgi:long-chain fatty acid transport protein
MFMKKQLLVASILLSAMTSFGGGYQLNLQGLRQLAMGGTGTAWPWDASTIFYNPGGLGRLKSVQVYASVMSIMPSTAYSNQNNSGVQTINTNTVRQSFTPFSVYVGGPVQQYSRVAIGLGIYTPFGSGTKWDDNWVGKYIVQSIDLKCVFFQPTISYVVRDWLSVGGGFIYSTGSLDFKQALPVHGVGGPGVDDGQATLHGSANGVGFNLGVHMKASDNLQFGITYRSQVSMNVSGGSANFKVPASLATAFPDTRFDSRLPLPQVASIGIGYRTGPLTLQFDLNYTGWNSYDTLHFNFDKTTTSLQNVAAPRHYRNTLTPRVGASYKISRVIALMAGGAYDPTPVTNGFVSPDLPDADRIVLSCGISIKPLPRFTILAAFEGVTSVVRNGSYNYAGFNGLYKTEAATPGIGVYYSF